MEKSKPGRRSAPGFLLAGQGSNWAWSVGRCSRLSSPITADLYRNLGDLSTGAVMGLGAKLAT